MKRCPECRRDYYDDSLLYCLDDGSALLEGPLSEDASETAILPSSEARDAIENAGKKKMRISWLVAGFLAAAVLVYGGWRFGRSGSATQGALGIERVTLTPLTNDLGYEGEPTFSVDGETVAYTSNRTGDFEIYIQQVSGGPYRNITESPNSDDVQPAYSPDGKQLAFVSSRSSVSSLRYEGYDLPLMGGDIWVMPALGGNARRVAREGNFPSWSPDGSAILYISGPAYQQKIYRITANGGEPAEIVPKGMSGYDAPRFLLYPVYSGDEKWIAFEADSTNAFGWRQIWVMNSESGEAQPIAQGRSPKWNADSTAIIYSNSEPGRNLSLWQVPFSTSQGKATDKAEPLTVGRGRDIQAAVSRDGRTVAFAGVDFSFNVETLAFDAETGKVSGSPVEITSGRWVSYFQSFSPDGKSIVIESHQDNRSHIWKVQKDSKPVQLTAEAVYEDTIPRWSPDGRNILFKRKQVKDGRPIDTLWRMSDDGANPHVVEADPWAGGISWMPDGRRVVFVSNIDHQIYLLDTANSSRTKLTNEGKIVPILAVNPDGNWVVFQTLESGTIDLKVVGIEGGGSRTVVATPHQDYHPFISPSGKWLYFQRDHKNIWRVPGPAQNWRQAEPEQITNLLESGLFLEDPQISRDGKQLLYAKGNTTSDIWIMKFEK
jgi:TolB protein